MSSILADFNYILIFSSDFLKILKKTSFMKIRPVVAESYYTDGQTATNKLVVFFRNFAKAPKELAVIY